MNEAQEKNIDHSATEEQIPRQIGLYLGTRQVMSETYTQFCPGSGSKVSFRVDGATELGIKISQSVAAVPNVRAMPELKFVADWP